MDALKFYGRIIRRLFPDAKAAVTQTVVSLLAIGAGVGMYSWLGGSFSWLPWLVLGISLVWSFLRSTYKEHEEVARRIGGGMVVSFPHGASFTKALPPPKQARQTAWQRMESMQNVRPIAWNVRLADVEITNHLSRTVSLHFEAVFSWPGGEKSCTLDGKKRALGERRVNPRIVIPPNGWVRASLDGSLPVYGAEQLMSAAPELLRVKVTDHAVHPELSFTLTALPGSHKLS